MFSNGSSSSISLLTVTPSLVTVGPPNDLLIITLRPVGPSVMADGVGQFVYAGEHLGPGGVVEHQLLCHGYVSYFNNVLCLEIAKSFAS